MKSIVRFTGAAGFAVLLSIPPVFAQDGYAGTWTGNVSIATVTISVQSVQQGMLIGSMTAPDLFTYTLSAAPPDAVNAQGVVNGNNLQITTPGGLYNLQLAGANLAGTFVVSADVTWAVRGDTVRVNFQRQ